MIDNLLKTERLISGLSLTTAYFHSSIYSNADETTFNCFEVRLDAAHKLTPCNATVKPPPLDSEALFKQKSKTIQYHIFHKCCAMLYEEERTLTKKFSLVCKSLIILASNLESKNYSHLNLSC